MRFEKEKVQVLRKTKDDNIHKSEALKRLDKRTLTLAVMFQNFNHERMLIHKSKQNDIEFCVQKMLTTGDCFRTYIHF